MKHLANPDGTVTLTPGTRREIRAVVHALGGKAPATVVSGVLSFTVTPDTATAIHAALTPPQPLLEPEPAVETAVAHPPSTVPAPTPPAPRKRNTPRKPRTPAPEEAQQ